MQALLKGRAQPIVGLNMIDIDGVSARFRVVQDVQKCRPGRLLLVCDIAMPGNTSRVFEQQILSGGVIGSAVHEMDLGIPFGAAIGGMNVQAAEVGAEIESFLNGQIGKILIEKDEDFSLGGKESELVLAGVRKAA